MVTNIKNLGEVPSIGRYKNNVMVRSKESNVAQLFYICGVYSDRTWRDEFRKVGDGVVSNVESDFIAIERDCPVTRGAASIVCMRAGVGIRCQIPQQDVAGPISGGSHGNSTDSSGYGNVQRVGRLGD